MLSDDISSVGSRCSCGHTERGFSVKFKFLRTVNINRTRSGEGGSRSRVEANFFLSEHIHSITSIDDLTIFGGQGKVTARTYMNITIINGIVSYGISTGEG